MMLWFWFGLLLMCSVPLTITIWLVILYFYLRKKYLHHVLRIFQEKPLFIIPRGQPLTEAESVRFPTTNGLILSGCYLKALGARRGVILFAVEFRSDCWSCRPYCEHLVEAGFDVFAFESRNQGTSDSQVDYDPLPWVTEYEVQDACAALAYLKSRPDADARGVGFFGISRGAGAGLIAGADDPYIRCFLTDGVFATYTTIVPYMRQWYRLYNHRHTIQGILPSWYYGMIGRVGLHQIERKRNCRFPQLERAVPRLSPRPWLLIHGEGDAYIKPMMAQSLFDHAREPREFWLVPGAKHNQALQVAASEYRHRVLDFFEKNLLGRESRAESPEPERSRPRAHGCHPPEQSTPRALDSRLSALD
jgi:predicted alpha/beta hydrolase